MAYVRYWHKVLTYICRVQSRHSPGGEGVGGQYLGRRQKLDWPLIQYNLSTGIGLGPWRSMFFILMLSFIQCISVSVMKSKISRRCPHK
jgi:hypothetical protein